VERAHYTLMSGWCPCYLDGMYDATRWFIVPFHHVVGSTTMSIFSWCGVWWKMMDDFLLVIVFFFFFSFVPEKVHDYSFFVFQFQFLFFWFFIFILIYFIKVLCFQFSPSITTCHMLFVSFRSLFFWFLIFFLDPFVKVLLFSILSFNQSSCCFIFFQFDPYFLYFFFFC